MVFAPPPWPLGGGDHELCNFDAPSGTDASDQVWLELAKWFLRPKLPLNTEFSHNCAISKEIRVHHLPQHGSHGNKT